MRGGANRTSLPLYLLDCCTAREQAATTTIDRFDARKVINAMR